MKDYVEKLLSGDRRSAARLITLIENDAPEKQALLHRLYPHTGRAHVVGVTGSPGAGKSSLVDALTGQIRNEGLKVGIIAVDPTSPFSGGALLGDRIRMQEHTTDRGVFIRSMGTRGCLGGLAQATRDAVKVLDAYGCDVILVETVGVGQSELDIMHHADTTLVVLNPGAGDHIQTIKAGIMEIADIFVINKADLDGVEKLVRDIRAMLDSSPRAGDWRPPVLTTSTLDGRGIPELWATIKTHREKIFNNGTRSAVKRKRIQRELTEILQRRINRLITQGLDAGGRFEPVLEEILARRMDPYRAADEIIKQSWKGELSDE
ncbi:methylmalonyl Co-A mutase-associated GTPase MeaB [Desulfotomaculum copahuensis]|uniref:GTPase n=1 Tax=Desulfotomaculum copahuensis TaxID=1838280 RepID=A0A1B7LEN5_9FIRM|nr:methylmalonyl Co-A mutase-associated GTPase MeaB [Desulfotomaculum copahuensis]OAT81751.1 GTPase [Desulfotomaculum copahuensis]